jgi:hypothetical protein
MDNVSLLTPSVKVKVVYDGTAPHGPAVTVIKPPSLTDVMEMGDVDDTATAPALLTGPVALH